MHPWGLREKLRKKRKKRNSELRRQKGELQVWQVANGVGAPCDTVIRQTMQTRQTTTNGD